MATQSIANNKDHRANDGSGSIRQKTRTDKDGNTKKYYEGRVSLGYNTKTGRYERRSVTGRTMKETQAKMTALINAVNTGAYAKTPKKKEQERLTVSAWADTWLEYCSGIKPRTLNSYKTIIEQHIKPLIGDYLLTALTTEDIELRFYKKLTSKSNHGKNNPLAPKTKKNIIGTLHAMMELAVEKGKIPKNPCEKIRGRDKVLKPETTPLDEDDFPAFLKAIEDDPYRDIYYIALFLGLREGEILGLSWDEIDFRKKTITIAHQLQKDRDTKEYNIVLPKNSKPRTLNAPDDIMELLENIRLKQLRQQREATENGITYSNPNGLVFTKADGSNLVHQTVYLHYKDIAAAIGKPASRFHDLRHSYCIVCVMNGDDVKTIQANLGHATPEFTLNVYSSTTNRMRKESAIRMNDTIRAIKEQAV